MGLVSDIQACKACSLCKNMETAPVKPTWAGFPTLMFIVGSPVGPESDLYQDPIPRSSDRRRLSELILEVGPIDWYITPMLKCIPKNVNRYLVGEVRTCVKTWIDKEISTVKPKVIVGLGGEVSKFVKIAHQFGSITKITSSKKQEKLFVDKLRELLYVDKH